MERDLELNTLEGAVSVAAHRYTAGATKRHARDAEELHRACSWKMDCAHDDGSLCLKAGRRRY